MYVSIDKRYTRIVRDCVGAWVGVYVYVYVYMYIDSCTAR